MDDDLLLRFSLLFLARNSAEKQLSERTEARAKAERARLEAERNRR